MSSKYSKRKVYPPGFTEILLKVNIINSDDLDHKRIPRQHWKYYMYRICTPLTDTLIHVGANEGKNCHELFDKLRETALVTLLKLCDKYQNEVKESIIRVEKNEDCFSMQDIPQSPELLMEQMKILLELKIIDTNDVTKDGKLWMTIDSLESRISRILFSALKDKLGFKSERECNQHFGYINLENLLKSCLEYSEEVYLEGERRSFWRAKFEAERKMSKIKLLLYKMKIINKVLYKSKKEIKIEDYKDDILLTILQKVFPDDVESQLEHRYEYSLKSLEELLKLAYRYFENEVVIV